MNIIEQLSTEFHVKNWQAEAVVKLLDDGNTVPFIARYRKEAHGELDDQVLREMSERLGSLRSLEKRRDEILGSMETLGVLTDEIRKDIEEAATMSRLEDLYRPYRPKRRTRAMIAREKGLEPLADVILLQLTKEKDFPSLVDQYLNEEKQVNSREEAIQGAMDIIAERISDDPALRQKLKDLYHNECQIRTKAAVEEETVYRMYYDYSEPIRTIPSHRILAINRGEKEEKLKVSLEVDTGRALKAIHEEYIAHTGSITTQYVEAACADAYTRLIAPSLDTEIRNELTDRAQKEAIRVFGLNLKPLLMQPPVKGKVALGLDPGIRMGCKCAVVDETGKVLDTAVIFPLPAHGKVREAKETLKKLILKHKVSIAAIGNGTAGRETEAFFVELMHEMDLGKDLSYMIVSEAGASVYSASKLAAEEFPQFDVNLRSAVSIARRLQDPLAELVKIDPKAIGVGQYQHDLKESELDETLDGVVEDCVNAVGVDLNTASPSLLSHVAGINSTVAKNIVTYREENGAFATRATLKKVPKLGPKAFEQCAGFLRIPGGKNPMENTGVHPESYAAAEAILKKFRMAPADAIGGKLEEMAEQYGIERLAEEVSTGVPTVRDIIRELGKPGRDPRDELPPPLLRSDVLDITDLEIGMELKGTVRNVTDFGAFVDIGVHRDGLVHISQMANRRIRHPSEVVRVGDIVTVWILDFQKETNRISLTMRKPVLKPDANKATDRNS